MASIQGLRHLERPAEFRGRSKHVRGRKLIVVVSLLVAGTIAALAAAFSAGGNVPTTGTFLHNELGAVQAQPALVGSAPQDVSLVAASLGQVERFPTVDRHQGVRTPAWNLSLSEKVELTSRLESALAPEWTRT